MAHYVRFEVYVPVHFTTVEESAETGGKVLIKHSLDSELVSEFANEAVLRFGGVTQAHPAGGPPYRGWWWSDTQRQLMPDDVTYLFTLVEISRLDEAEEFFSLWQTRFAKEMSQEVILVVRWPIQTLGGFL